MRHIVTGELRLGTTCTKYDRASRISINVLSGASSYQNLNVCIFSCNRLKFSNVNHNVEYTITMAVEKLTYKDGDNPNTKYLLRYKGYNMQGMIEFRFQHEAIVMIFQLEIFLLNIFD